MSNSNLLSTNLLTHLQVSCFQQLKRYNIIQWTINFLLESWHCLCQRRVTDATQNLICFHILDRLQFQQHSSSLLRNSLKSSYSCYIATHRRQLISITIIIWSEDTVTKSHLTKCNTNSKVRAMSAQLTIHTLSCEWLSTCRPHPHALKRKPCPQFNCRTLVMVITILLII